MKFEVAAIEIKHFDIEDVLTASVGDICTNVLPCIGDSEPYIPCIADNDLPCLII